MYFLYPSILHNETICKMDGQLKQDPQKIRKCNKAKKKKQLYTFVSNAKDTLSVGSSDPEVIDELHDSLTLWIFWVTVPHLLVA